MGGMDLVRPIATGAEPVIVKEPEECRSMAEVRVGVDALDSMIIELLAIRFRYMDAAARIKQARSEVRDEARKSAVLDHVREVATVAGAPAGPIVALYDGLIEASIAYELEQFDSGPGPEATAAVR